MDHRSAAHFFAHHRSTQIEIFECTVQGTKRMPDNQRIALNRISVLSCVLISLSLFTPVAANDEQVVSDHRVIRWGEISTEQLADVRIKAIDDSVVQHAREIRGFVSVPLDYSAPVSREIDIFYRLLPSEGSTAANSGHPILMIMNGGPGMPSSGYRALDYDYEVDKPSDAFSELAKHFRILMVDQRGTGNSAPLALDDSALSPEIIARLFDSDEHARDHARVINEVIPDDELFFVLARSYGGEIGFHYLTLDKDFRQPVGMIFSSAILPHTNSLDTFLMRRKKQKELNLELLEVIPGISTKLERLRIHLESLGMDRRMVNFLWADLGKGVGWEKNLETKVDRLISIGSRSAMEAEFGQGIQESVSLLNYVLSSSALTAGYTDRSMTEETGRQIPFDPWMLDENWTLNQIGNDGTWREAFIAAVDHNPPPPTRFPSVDEIRGNFANTQVLFTFGKSDVFLPQNLQFDRAQKFSVPGHTEFRILSGGHGAAFSEDGARVVAGWASQIIDERTTGLDFQ